VKPNSEADLQAAVAQQPVVVAVEADKAAFQMYTGGVLDSDDCGDQLDHRLLVVGYGSENGKEYWIAQNSWGGSAALL
jgi:cathepsin L